MTVPSFSGHQVLLQLEHRKWTRSPTANRSAVAAAAIPATPASSTGAKPASWTATQRDKVVSICVYPVHSSLRQVFVPVPSFARGHYEFVGLSWTKWKTGFDPQGMRNGIERELCLYQPADLVICSHFRVLDPVQLRLALDHDELERSPLQSHICELTVSGGPSGLCWTKWVTGCDPQRMRNGREKGAETRRSLYFKDTSFCTGGRIVSQ